MNLSPKNIGVTKDEHLTLIRFFRAVDTVFKTGSVSMFETR